MIVALAGGVGASKFLRGLVHVMDPANITVIVNTADDIAIAGLHISPDLDTVVYSLADVADQDRGWGLAGETWHALNGMSRYGMPTWFRLGDRDLATHLYRTSRLRDGATLAQVTSDIAVAWEVKSKILPMTNDLVQNRVVLGNKSHVASHNNQDREDLHFQEYLIERGAPDSVISTYISGIDTANGLPEALDALTGAEGIVVCPSNPVVSIGPILALPRVEELIRDSRNRGCRRIAISPIVSGAPLRGPADRLMPSAGIDVSCVGIAKHYSELIDTCIIDSRDSDLAQDVEAHVHCVAADTVMTSIDIAENLARQVLDLLG